MPRTDEEWAAVLRDASLRVWSSDPETPTLAKLPDLIAAMRREFQAEGWKGAAEETEMRSDKSNQYVADDEEVTLLCDLAETLRAEVDRLEKES